MSDGVVIPVSVPGAEQAKDALEEIVTAFDRLDHQVAKASESSEDAMKAAQRLGGHLGGAATQAHSLRESLANVKDTGLDELSEKAAELASKIGGVGGEVAELAIKSAASFGPVGIAITAVGAALALLTQAYDEHAAKVALADAQTLELSNALNNLGTTYPSVAAAVDRATTAVQAHTSAIAENQRVLGQQLTALNAGMSATNAQNYTRRLQEVSGAVRELGTFLHGASEEQIRQTLETGNLQAQQALLGISFEHSTNAMKEANNHTNAMIVLHQRAAVAIAESKDRAVEAARAALSSAQADLVEARGLEDVHDRRAAMLSATQQVTEATAALTEAQHRAATAHQVVAQNAAEASRAEAELAATTADARTRAGAPASEANKSEERRKSRSDASAEEALRRRLDILQRTKEKIDSENALIRSQEAAIRERYQAERDEIDRTRRASLDSLTERLREEEARTKEMQRAKEDQAKSSSQEGRRTSMRRQREESVASQTATLADLRDPAVQMEMLRAAEMDRAITRERAQLEQRYELQRSYVDRMQELHGVEANGAQGLAESVSGAFGGMAEAFGQHLQALVAGKETLQDALQGMLSDTLLSIAQQATVKGAMELAEGASALAGVVTAPLAPGHFAAAGLYFGVAALAGAAGAATAPSAPAASAPAPSGSGSKEPAAKLSSGNPSMKTEGGTVYNINFGGPMYGTGGVRQAARQMVGAINRGGIQGGVQILPGVLQGSGVGS